MSQSDLVGERRRRDEALEVQDIHKKKAICVWLSYMPHAANAQPTCISANNRLRGEVSIAEKTNHDRRQQTANCTRRRAISDETGREDSCALLARVLAAMYVPTVTPQMPSGQYCRNIMADIRAIIAGEERHDGSACAACRLAMAAARVRRFELTAAQANEKRNDFPQGLNRRIEACG